MSKFKKGDRVYTTYTTGWTTGWVAVTAQFFYRLISDPIEHDDKFYFAGELEVLGNPVSLCLLEEAKLHLVDGGSEL